MSDQVKISFVDFHPEYRRKRNGILLWTYDSEKSKCGYVTENDDLPKSKGVVTQPPEEDLVRIK